jgi:acetyltransferase-like isoleucine patch superfamily enzyme
MGGVRFLLTFLRTLLDGGAWLLNRLLFAVWGVSVGARVTIRGVLFIRNYGRLSIGEGARLNSRMSVNPIGGACRTIFCVEPGAELSIGEGSAISNTAFSCWQRIRIGREVFIGGNCKIYDTDFHPLGLEARIRNDRRLTKTAPVEIGDGAFIGGHTIILKGVVVGAEAVIGAGSVVACDVPARQVWAGNPARFIRSLDGPRD